MRILALVALASAALAAGCSNSCIELGERLCDCRTSGTTKNSCVDNVRAEVKRLNPGGDEKSACSRYLDSCHGPGEIEFCDWLEGRCGKAACGLSQEDLGTLRETPVDEADPDCAEGAEHPEDCEMVCR
jgi:hypothetical protein